MTPLHNYISYLKRRTRKTDKTLSEMHEDYLARETAVSYGVDPDADVTLRAIKEAENDTL